MPGAFLQPTFSSLLGNAHLGWGFDIQMRWGLDETRIDKKVRAMVCCHCNRLLLVAIVFGNLPIELIVFGTRPYRNSVTLHRALPVGFLIAFGKNRQKRKNGIEQMG